MDLKQITAYLHDARVQQADAKEELLAAQRHYDECRAEAYLKCDGGHYKAQAGADVDPKVKAARVALDTAAMRHYRCWVECNIYLIRLTNARGFDDAMRDEWENNRPVMQVSGGCDA